MGSGLTRAVKRAIDVAGAGAGLVILSPLVALVAGLLRASIGSPVFFRQERPGLGGRPFVLIKFRTMLDLRGPSGESLPDDERMTRTGRIVRGLSLDELPQLWNVLRGEMSLVGPRPLLMRYLPRYTTRQARRHEVRPGITGWAQVNGRNAISWPDKLELDVWYVEHWSLALDLRILGVTLLRVVRREGVSRAGHATMPEFMGTQGSDDRFRA